MSSQPIAVEAHSDSSQYQPGAYAKLNALIPKYYDVKKKYATSVAYNKELKSCLDTVKTDFKKITAAYENLSESDMARRVEVETLKQKCDVLKRRNNELEERNKRSRTN